MSFSSILTSGGSRISRRGADLLGKTLILPNVPKTPMKSRKVLVGRYAGHPGYPLDPPLLMLNSMARFFFKIHAVHYVIFTL